MKKCILALLTILILQPKAAALMLLQSGNGKIILERTFVVKEAARNEAYELKQGILENTIIDKTGNDQSADRSSRALESSLPQDRQQLNEAAAVNLTFYGPTGWSAPLVISNTSTATVSSASDATTILNTQDVFVSFAIYNNGADPSPATLFYTYIYVDDVLKFQGTVDFALSTNYAYWINRNIGQYTAGSHTFKMVVDATNIITESNESDNTYQRSKTISSATLPSITSFSPSVGSFGTSVTISGSNFGATQGAGGVQFGTTSAGITSWSNTQIIATVPNLTSGNYTITVLTGNGNISSSTQFTVLSSTSTLDPLPSLYRVTLSSAITTGKINYFTEKFGAVWIAGDNGLVAKTSSAITAGSPILWTRMSTGIPTTEHIYALEFATSTLGFAGTGTGKIYRTTDGGSSWTVAYNIPSVTGFINYIKFDNSTTGIAVGDGKDTVSSMAFLYTSDGGVSWSNNNTYLIGYTTPSQVFFPTANLGYLAGTLSTGTSKVRGVFKTTNAGASWNFYSVAKNAFDSSIFSVGLVFRNSLQGIAVKNDSTLWRTLDGGVTWNKIGQLPHWGYGLAYLNSTTALVVGSHGMVAQANLSTNGIYSISVDINKFLESPLITSTSPGIFINVYNQNGTFFTTFYPSIPLTIPSILSPSNGSPVTSTNVSLSWSSISGATSYDVEVGTIISSSIRGKIYTTSTTLFSIPDLAPGTTYQWRVRARSLTNSSGWSSLFNFITPSQQVISNVVSASFPATPKNSTDYRLITIPTSTPMTVSGLIKGSTPNDFRIYKDNGGIPPNHLSEMDGSSTVQFGVGYWLIKKNDFVIDGTFDLPTPANGFVMLSMTGFNWNIIGNPYSVPVKWSDVITANSLAANSVLYAYKGESGFVSSNVMEPFAGYYYFSNSGSLNIPFPFSSTTSETAPEPHLKFSLTYSSSMNNDRTSFFGIDPSAQSGIDQFETRKPPIFSDQGSVWFDRPEWDPKHSRFASDIRPFLADGQTWDFVVRHPLKESAKIRVDNMDQLPDGYSAVVLNRSTGVTTKVDNKGEINLSLPNDETALTLIVGKTNYIRSKTEEFIPAQFELYQNYPNPFNPTTSIRFGLAEDALVQIKIYDLLGREIQTLTHDMQSAGNHEYPFDAHSFASGTYLYSLKAVSLHSGKLLYTATKKMMLLK
ncbi:MAG: IPT/TIG domain-containing protein [Ignavibacteriales bacterium]|nr:IPT/TIG domain-containing protein [Ignavibacteriales bacterium]